MTTFGAPVESDLDPQDAETRQHSHVVWSYTDHRDVDVICPSCGRYALRREVVLIDKRNNEVIKMGHVTACQRCQSQHWMFYTHSARADEMRRRAAHTVV